MPQPELCSPAGTEAPLFSFFIHPESLEALEVVVPMGLGPENGLGSPSTIWVSRCFLPMSVLVCSCICVLLRPYLIAGNSAFSQEPLAGKIFAAFLLRSPWLPGASFLPAQLLSAHPLFRTWLMVAHASCGVCYRVGNSSHARGFPRPTTLNEFLLRAKASGQRVIFV